jgi:type IV pilus assembly protein PilE
MMQARQCGLTLIELMVVVAVMAILASVAYPLYTNQTQKARRADAKIALESIAMAQERFYTINGGYTDDFSALYTGTLAQAAGFDWPCDAADSCDTSQGYYVVSLSQTSSQDFAASAAPVSGGAQDSDKCVSFSLDQLGGKGSDPATGCW